MQVKRIGGKKSNINSNVVFCIFLAFMVVSIILAAFLADSEKRGHESNYAAYVNADKLYDEDEVEKALAIYNQLSLIYPKSYVLEYKVAACEYYLEDFESAKARALKTLQLQPRLVEDASFLEFLASCFELTGDEAAAKVVEERMGRK